MNKKIIALLLLVVVCTAASTLHRIPIKKRARTEAQSQNLYDRLRNFNSSIWKKFFGWKSLNSLPEVKVANYLDL